MGLLPGRRLGGALAAAGAVALLGACGGGDDAPRGDVDAGRPYPPRAAEPATSPAPGREPAGRIARVGDGPEGVAVDPRTRTVAVALEGGRLALVDADDGQVRRTIRIPPGARHIALARPGGPFLVPAEDADQLASVDPRSGDVQLARTGDGPHDATPAPGGRVVVADEFGSTVSVLRGGRLERTFPVDVQPGGVARVGADVAVVSVRAYTVELFALRRLGAQPGGGSQSAGEGPSHVVVGRDRRLWIADTRGGAVSVFETRPRLKFVARVRTGGSPYGLAMDRRRGRLWVTDPAANRVLVLDAAPGRRARVLEERPTVRQPNTVAADERTGRAYVTGKARGLVQILDP